MTACCSVMSKLKHIEYGDEILDPNHLKKCTSFSRGPQINLLQEEEETEEEKLFRAIYQKIAGDVSTGRIKQARLGFTIYIYINT